MHDVTDAAKLYERRTPRSRALFKRSQVVTPGGVSHGLRFFSPYPFFVLKAKGPRIWDVDGNEYVDFWMGHFALILGHSHPAIIAALTEQLRDGSHWGIVNELQVELAELVCRHVPSAESVRFCNTGAEATMYAVRIARGYTGRQVVLKAEGGWHGFCTDLMVATHGTGAEPDSLGLPRSLPQEVKTFPFNDVEVAVESIRREGDLAAVIVEPVLGSGGAIPADREFLQALREETQRKDALLIFDEIITGFRLGLGGAQELYGVTPDLTTLGKVLGGGQPIGAVVGSSEIMELSNPRRKPKVAIGGGTFSCNPLTMRAGIETISYLEREQDGYERIDALGERVRKELQGILSEGGLTVQVTGIGSLFQVHFLLKEGIVIRSGADVYERTDYRLRDGEFKLRLVNEGVYTMHGGGCLSFAHTEEEVERLLSAAERVAAQWGS